MYTVKRIKKGTPIRITGMFRSVAPKGCYAVYGPDDMIVITSGKAEIYKNEWVAQEVAASLNKGN